MTSSLGGAPGNGTLGEQPRTFANGVASSDPTATGVVIWTRVSGITDALVAVRWIVATDVGLREAVVQGTAASSAARDWTVHVDVSGLAAGATYYYGFSVGDEYSMVGRTRTLPGPDASRLRFALLAGQTNDADGNVRAHIAERDDIDFVLHLGECVDEASDPGVQALRAAHPTIASIETGRVSSRTSRVGDLAELFLRDFVGVATCDATWRLMADPLKCIELLDTIEAAGVGRSIVFTGDLHVSMAIELTHPNDPWPIEARAPIAVEVAARDVQSHGYVVVDVQPTEVVLQSWSVDAGQGPTRPEHPARQVVVPYGEGRIYTRPAQPVDPRVASS